MSGSQAREALDHVLALAGRGFDEAFTDGSAPGRPCGPRGPAVGPRPTGPALGALARHRPGSASGRCSG